MNQETRKERFLKVYANLPLGIRQEIVLVLDAKPITWNAAYIEVNNDTKYAEQILAKLDEFKII